MRKQVRIFDMMMALLFGMLMLNLVACEGGGAGASGASAPQPTTPISSTGKIYLYGDEIAKGDGATVSLSSLIATASKKEVVNRAYSTTNGGNWLASGAISTMNNTLGLNNNNLRDIGPSDIIVICVGYTDVRYFGNISQANYNLYMVPFMTAAYNTGAQIYVVTPPKMNAAVYGSFAPLNLGSDANMASFKTKLSNTVAGYNSSGVKLIDLQASFNPTAGNLQADLQLPNNSGHQAIATKLIQDMGF